jgi:hypothetical protein
MRIMFGRFLQGKERTDGSAHSHYYELAGMTEDGFSLRLPIDGGYGTRPAFPLDSLNGLETGDELDVELNVIPVPNVEQISGKTGQPYKTTLYRVSVTRATRATLPGAKAAA